MLSAKLALACIAPLALLSACGANDESQQSASEPENHSGVIAMLGTTTRCAVANNGPGWVRLTKIHFTYRCDGSQKTTSREAPMSVPPNNVVSLDVSVPTHCLPIVPLYCEVDYTRN